MLRCDAIDAIVSPPLRPTSDLGISEKIDRSTMNAKINQNRRLSPQSYLLSSLIEDSTPFYFIMTSNTTELPTEEETSVTQSLALDRPTIDAATKSFISLVVARSLSATDSDTLNQQHPQQQQQKQQLLGLLPFGVLSAQTASASASASANTDTDAIRASPNPQSTQATTASTQQQVLGLARTILQNINTYKFPIHDTVATTLGEKPGTNASQQQVLLELQIVAQLWNGLVDSNQKPSRFLGRRALRHAWAHLEIKIQNEDTAAAQQQEEWLEEFGRLLFQERDDQSEQDNDAAFLWDADGGTNELARRRQRRQAAATERVQVERYRA
jgi:hypothetical protein